MDGRTDGRMYIICSAEQKSKAEACHDWDIHMWGSSSGENECLL